MTGQGGDAAATRIPIHTRSYDTEAFADENGRMVVVGRLTDTKPNGLGLADGSPLTIHDMVLELVIEVPGFEIVDVSSEMLTHPYPTCPGILVDYRSLIGVSVARGFSREVRTRFGGPNGCSHLTALLQAMGPVAIQASWSLVKLRQPIPSPDAAAAGENLERRLAMNTNTCHVWSENGDLVRAGRAGGPVPVPSWERERLVALGSSAPPEG